jgi:hypothetical protein
MTATTLTMPRLAFSPPIPMKMEELGIGQSLVLDLFIRRLSMVGTTNLHSLSRTLKLSYPVIDFAFRNLRHQQLCEVKGMDGEDYIIAITSSGRALATERFGVSHYAGPAPVCLDQYHAACKAQAAHVQINRQVLREALSDLVVVDDMLDKIGPALVSQTSIFLYGPTGNGKTSFAERFLRVYRDAILVPYALEVDGQIINMYDPVVHRKIDSGIDDIDPRWLLCERPCIIVGGELVPSMLEMRLDETAGVYAAPLQLKANNGILIIDDFGRQLMAPRDLLNRWIVPLDRRVDYLSLQYGVKFQIPFELMVVFATNLKPSDLADEAFIRRIQNKIYIDAVQPAVFDEIFRRVARARNLSLDPGCAEKLRDLCLSDGREDLRACYPVDICDILQSIGTYEGRPVRLSGDDLRRAVELYFARD